MSKAMANLREGGISAGTVFFTFLILELNLKCQVSRGGLSNSLKTALKSEISTKGRPNVISSKSSFSNYTSSN